MRKTVSMVLSIVVVGLLMPLASAQVPGQATPVSECTMQCQPHADDVNGPEIKSGASTVKTILYGHFKDVLNRAPLNTQFPDSDEPNLNGGFLMPVINTELPDPVSDYNFHFINTWFEMYSSAGFVEIQDGIWRTHQEPGVAETIQIVGDEIPLYFYLSAYPIPNQNSETGTLQGNVVDVMPLVGVYARMETGRFRFGKGSEVIAQGDTGADNPIGTDARVNIITQPGQPDIYEIKVPMVVQKHEIPSYFTGNAGFIVSINPYQIKGKADPINNWHVMQNDWRLRVGPKTPIHLVVETANPMVTKAASLNLFNNNMFIRWSLVSPWGSYDIDDSYINSPESISISGGGKEVNKDATGLARPLIIKRSVDHDAHFKPVNVTWKFDYHKAALPDGDYTVAMNALNYQGTYRLEQSLTFKMKDGEPQDLQIVGGGASDLQDQGGQAGKGDSPGFDVALFAAAIVAVAFVVIRRRK